MAELGSGGSSCSSVQVASPRPGSPAPFLQCRPHPTPGGAGVLADPAKVGEEFRKAWLLYFCRSRQTDTSLEEFDRYVDGWLPLLLEIDLTRLNGQMLADVVQRKSVTAGSLGGWEWRELKVLPVSWCDGLARILTKVEDTGVWPDGLLDAYIAVIPKTDGDATPLGQRPLSVLPIVCRIWASARMCQLDGWFKSWVPDSVFSAGCGRGSVEACCTSSLEIDRFLLVLLIPMFTFLLLMLLNLLSRLIEVFWIVSSLVLGFLAGSVMLILNTMLMFGCVLSWLLVLVSPGLEMGVFLRVVP